MTVPILYKSSDSGAPVMAGTTTPGALLPILDACLVTGYGSKAGAGWSIEYTSATARVYRAPGGNRFYCYFNDAAVDSWPSMTGYINATGLGSGSGPFGAVVYMQRYAIWMVIADDRTFYTFMGNSLGSMQICIFGDIYSLVPGDNYGTMCAGRVAHTSTTTDDFMTNSGRCSIARSHTQTGSEVSMTCSAYSSSGGNVSGGSLVTWCPATWPFPNPADSAIHLGRFSISSPSLGLRGYLRGLWAVPHAFTNFSSDITDLTDFNGTGPFAGRHFVIPGALVGGAVVAVETTAWDHN
jgi:hypothetical protein